MYLSYNNKMTEKINITFLGTGSAIPTATRNHSAIYLKYKNENILIDCGEGTQRQLRKAKINLCKITRLLITHLHGDHVFGIPGLFQTLNLNNYNKTLEIYGPKGIKRFIKNIFKIFNLTRTIKIKTKVIEVNKSGRVVSKFARQSLSPNNEQACELGLKPSEFLKVFETKDFTISALPLEHGIPTLGYVFQEKTKLKINKQKLKKLNLSTKYNPKIAKLLQKKNIKIKNKTIKYKDLTYSEKVRKISIILDTKLCPNVKKLAKDSNLAIIESTSLDKTKYKHLTAQQAAQIAKTTKTKSLILTHLSQRYEFKENILLKQAKKIFPNTKIAEDFMKVEI